MSSEIADQVNYPDSSSISAKTDRDIWDENASYWDAAQGLQGNSFYRYLVLPAVLRLLEVPDPTRTLGSESENDFQILELACGNGIFTNHLLSLDPDISVLSTDISPRMVDTAKARAAEAGFKEPRVMHMTLDITSEEDIQRKLGMRRKFERIICNMALMDIPTINILANALRGLLVPGGSFIATVCHPSFNIPSGTTRVVEVRDDASGRTCTYYSIKTSKYLDVPVTMGEAIPGQPELQYYYHRPLHKLLKPFFKAGLVLDGLEEPSFHDFPTDIQVDGLSWSNYDQIPPILAFRLREIPRLLDYRDYPQFMANNRTYTGVENREGRDGLITPTLS